MPQSIRANSKLASYCLSVCVDLAVDGTWRHTVQDAHSQLAVSLAIDQTRLVQIDSQIAISLSCLVCSEIQFARLLDIHITAVDVLALVIQNNER